MQFCSPKLAVSYRDCFFPLNNQFFRDKKNKIHKNKLHSSIKDLAKHLACIHTYKEAILLFQWFIAMPGGMEPSN